MVNARSFMQVRMDSSEATYPGSIPSTSIRFPLYYRDATRDSSRHCFICGRHLISTLPPVIASGILLFINDIHPPNLPVVDTCKQQHLRSNLHHRAKLTLLPYRSAAGGQTQSSVLPETARVIICFVTLPCPHTVRTGNPSDRASGNVALHMIVYRQTRPFF